MAFLALLLCLLFAFTASEPGSHPLRGSPRWLQSHIPALSPSFDFTRSPGVPALQVQHETISGPSRPLNLTSWLDWFTALVEYRNTTLTAINYSSAVYDSPASAYVRRLFIQPQAMIHDRYLYSLADGYTVDRYLDDLSTRYGGIEAVLLWHSYPNIGVDARSQFDMLRSLPGYPKQVQAMVSRFHARNVKVLLPYNPWDTGQHTQLPPSLSPSLGLRTHSRPPRSVSLR